MTRKPTPAQPDTAEAPPPGMPLHPLPTEGGCFVIIEGAVRVDPAHAPTPTPEPEV